MVGTFPSTASPIPLRPSCPDPGRRGQTPRPAEKTCLTGLVGLAGAGGRRLEIGHGRDQLLADHLEPLRLVHLRHVPDYGLDAYAGQPFQAADHLAQIFAVVAKVERKQRGFLDVVVIAANGPAVVAQDVELAWDLGSGKEVAGVRILGHKPQRFLFAAATNKDWGVGAAERLRRVERTFELVVLAPERLFAATFSLPHLLADLECLLEPLEPFLDWRGRDAEAAAFCFVPCGANAQPRTAAG